MAINKVLVVDDSAAELSNIKKIIHNIGCSVISASNGKQALELAKNEKPDIIFMDILMPEMDGYEATRKLSNDPATRNIPIIFISSKGQKADKLWGQMQGAKGYITKPFTAEQIIDQIRVFNS
ncbi:MAG: response regulator [Gammaproteobacteria bacterium]|nr:response regulator [Gammaproteobacteria bacterium]